MKKPSKKLTIKNALKIQFRRFYRCTETGDTTNTESSKPYYSQDIDSVVQDIADMGIYPSACDIQHDLSFYGDSDSYDSETEVEDHVSIEGPEVLMTKLKIALLKNFHPEELETIKFLRRELLEDSPLKLVHSNWFGKSDSQSETFIGRKLKAV